MDVSTLDAAELQVIVRALAAENAAILSQLATLQLADRSARHAARDGDVARLTAELAAAQKDLTEERAATATVERLHAVAQRELQEATVASAGFREQIQSLEDLCATLSADKEGLAERVDEFECAAEQAGNNMEDMTSHIAGKESAVADLERELSAATRKAGKLEAANGKLKMDNEHLDRSYKAAARCLADENELAKKWGSQLANAKKNLGAFILQVDNTAAPMPAEGVMAAKEENMKKLATFREHIQRQQEASRSLAAAAPASNGGTPTSGGLSARRGSVIGDAHRPLEPGAQQPPILTHLIGALVEMMFFQATTIEQHNELAALRRMSNGDAAVLHAVGRSPSMSMAQPAAANKAGGGWWSGK